MLDKINSLISEIDKLEAHDKIAAINTIKLRLHEISPFKNEPVDCVIWVPSDEVVSNLYNPNTVAPPEMELLKVSIEENGYTQPIVTYKNSTHREIVDGFHRNRVGKEDPDINKRINNYLPVTTINEWNTDKCDRMAATIRHNRARGKHGVEAMSAIVVELKKRNWSSDKIAKKLGMNADEVIRLMQISGLAELFKDRNFSEAWEAEEFEAERENNDLIRENQELIE